MIQQWIASTGQPLGEPLCGHKGEVKAVAYSPDGSKIISSSKDHTIRLWDANTSWHLGELLRGPERSVNTEVSPGGSQMISNLEKKLIRMWDDEIDADAGSLKRDVQARIPLGLMGPPSQIVVPGFRRCSLLPDGWVQSSGKLLFWVPPENRHGLQYPHLLTMPTTSSLRATKVDFTHFQCGPSWTNVRKERH